VTRDGVCMSVVDTSLCVYWRTEVSTDLISTYTLCLREGGELC
jgi:hypothetical protein